MERRGFFVNRGGEMLAEFNLGVPIMPRVDLGSARPVPEYADLPCGNDVRWFDNYGRLRSVNNRFGGEFQGMTPVWNFTPEGTVSLEGHMAWFGNKYVRRCQVYCVEVPSLIVLEDMVCNTESRLDSRFNVWVGDGEGDDDDKSCDGLPVAASSLIPYQN